MAVEDLDLPLPCVGICRLEPEPGLCVGCLRTGDEVAAWPSVSLATRLEILTALQARRRAVGRTSARDLRPRRRARRP